MNNFFEEIFKQLENIEKMIFFIVSFLFKELDSK